jgi:hypothetical protein
MTIQQTDIDALTDAIAAGERVVRKGDKTVELYSKAELIRARDALVAQKAAEDAIASGKPRPKQTRLYHAGRGY